MLFYHVLDICQCLLCTWHFQDILKHKVPQLGLVKVCQACRKKTQKVPGFKMVSFPCSYL